MKNMKKALLFSTIVFLSLFFAPNFVHAEVKTVGNETQLVEAIENASAGEVISLSSNIVLTSPIQIVDKNITIDGNNHTITRSAEDYHADGNNSTLITAGKSGTIVNLKNMKLVGAEKYGVQSYNGAYVSLDGVTISDCGYGAVLVNAGTVEVRNLILNKNGTPDNNGIEIAKGDGVYDEGVKPVLRMNGTLSSTETKNVVYLAVNDTLTDFDVENTDDSPYKVFVSGHKLVVTDPNNNIVFESNENYKEGLKIDGEEYTPNITITIHVMNNALPYEIAPNTTISSEELQSQINLSELGLENYTIAGFYSDEELTSEFDFTKEITTDTSVYVKLSEKVTAQEQQPAPEPEKDNTPKTGFDNKIGLAIFVIALSSIAMIYTKKK